MSKLNDFHFNLWIIVKWKYFDSVTSTFSYLPNMSAQTQDSFQNLKKKIGHKQTGVSQANLLNKWQHQIKDIQRI